MYRNQGCLVRSDTPGCAPLYYKCRLQSNGQLKSSYDVTGDNDAGERGKDFHLPVRCKKKEILPLSHKQRCTVSIAMMTTLQAY